MAAYPAINKSRAQLTYNLSPRNGTAIRYIVVHYTATTAAAENNCIYFGSANRNSSADYFIDKNGAIWQYNADPRGHYSWHCGDGGGRYGITNSNSIGIEVVSAGEPYTEQEIESLHKLVKALQEDYGVPDANVVRHYDASRKICPAPYAGSNDSKWPGLKTEITRAEEDIVTPEDRSAIARETANILKAELPAAVWTYGIGERGVAGKNNAPAWQRLGWANGDAYDAKVSAESAKDAANKAPKDTVTTLLGTEVQRKDTGQKMSILNMFGWACADATGNASKLGQLIKKLIG